MSEALAMFVAIAGSVAWFMTVTKMLIGCWYWANNTFDSDAAVSSAQIIGCSLILGGWSVIAYMIWKIVFGADQ